MLIQKEEKFGFTLLELLVVVVLVGILASIALPGYTKMMERSRVKEAEATLNMIFQAERVYRLDNNTYGDVIPPVNQGDPYTGQLIANNYLPSPSSADWTFATSNTTATTFTATATRNGTAGVGYGQNIITVDQGFNGSTYNGDHPLR